MFDAISHNDDPVLEDAFGQKDFIEHICKVIKDCQPPKGIAINGYWGTGKTSALMQVYYCLSAKHPYDETRKPIDKTITPVWFEAWRYQHETQPIVALLNEIREQMGLWKKFQQETKKLASVTLLGAVNAFDEAIKAASGGLFKPQLGKIPEIGKQWEAQRHFNPLPSQTIHRLLEGAIDQALGTKNGRRLVIFIDDLDRCTPAVALQLLEGIKVYLNLKNCVIVFGMDQRQIERALGKALEPGGDDEYSNVHQAREYLEKICQDVYHLPLPNQDAKAEFFIRLLKQLQVSEGDGARHQEKLEPILRKYDCLPANPRKIKALVNRIAALLLHVDMGDGSDLLPGTAISRHYALLMAITVIYCFHRRYRVKRWLCQRRFSKHWLCGPPT
ncbi:MAG: hypothetical protein GY862_28450 [Gammaproteobacteria bacterium]|nr:hypothetical protein [Gammaproteobacteria bacterium]